MSPKSQLGDLVDSYLDLKWHVDPVEATGAGVASHDGRLGAYRDEDVSQFIAALKSLGAAFEECEIGSLEDEIDRTAVLNDLRVTIHRFERERPQTKDPSFWITHALEGLYLLLALRDRPADHRRRAVADRVAAIPGFLEHARSTLESCPTPFLATAAEVTHAGGLLVDQVREEFVPSEEANFADACEAAKAALSSFADHLDSLSTEEASGDFAIGERAFNFRLQYEHAIQAVASEIWRYGHSLIDEVESQLDELAKDISPAVRWPDLVHRLRGTHPAADELVQAYKDGMERAYRFVEHEDLVTIPDGSLEVVPTPAFLRPLIPFAAYQPPGAFSEDRTGWFYVTQPSGDTAQADVDRALRDHCTYEIACTSLHEGVPGHHLQFLRAQTQTRKVRKVLGTPLTIEGWALYCEDLMDESGFYQNREERFFQRLALMWRAVRVVVDVGLHTRGMSFDEAVDLLVNRVHFDAKSAGAEVRRYCAHPAYQLCYAVGRRELKALRDAYRERTGGEYTLRKFHDAVLSYGGLPVSLIRWGMGLGS
ncbi:MAG: DUF885 domain-containing protein [Gemmatimonadales bacterium]